MIKKEGLFGNVTITDAEGEYSYYKTDCPSCASKDAELLRIRGIEANEKHLLDIVKRDEAELKSLRSLAERAEDVDALTAAILSVSFDREGESWADAVARRVREYLKEGR